MKQKLYSNGKLLLTGEYLILDGAEGLAIPCQYGQSMEIQPIDALELIWSSKDINKNTWFQATFNISSLTTQSADPIAKKLSSILQTARELNPSFLIAKQGCNVITQLDFPQDWGLGSSSTLINNLATWAAIDPYQLLDKTFGGSGYDIAAAQNSNPIVFKRFKESREVKTVSLDWTFTHQLFFVHLNKKQNSREGISRYVSKRENISGPVLEISEITQQLINTTSLPQFEALMNQHEAIVSEIIQEKTIKERLFSDYPRMVKSLGAWGGDFILVSGSTQDRNYFIKKGYSTIIDFDTMLLAPKI